MNTMQSIMSIRLPQEDVKTIKEIAATEKIDKSTAVRELVEGGLIYFSISKYREGRISIGKAAEIAHLSLSEMIDLLAGLGIPATMDLGDYLAGSQTAGKLV